MTIKRFAARAWLAAIDAFDRNCVPCGSPGLRCMVSRGNQAELAVPDRQSGDYDLELQRMTAGQVHPGQVIRVLLCVNGKLASEVMISLNGIRPGASAGVSPA
jgi:hypothetical protein